MLSNKFSIVSVGDSIENIDGPVNRTAINRYAETSGDRNPIHTTYDVAMAAGLKGVIQHGLFSMAWLIKMLTTWLGNEGKLRKINIQFRSMVRPGDEVISKGAILKKYQEKDANLLDLEVIQEAWSPLCRGIAQAADPAINADSFQKLLSKAKLRMEAEINIEDDKVQAFEKEIFKIEVKGFEILSGSLSFWECFTRGWVTKGDIIHVELSEPPKNGKAPFSIYKISQSIKGTATVQLFSE